MFKRIFVTSSVSALVMVGCADTQTTPPDYSQPLAQQTVEAPATPPPPPIVSSKHATLTNLNLNNLGNQITIKPGRSIQATINYAYNCPKCKPDLGNQIIIGLARRSAQVCIYNGGVQGQGAANFELRVPAKPGKYDIRFRVLQAADCNEALRAGWGDDNSPSSDTTIGRIIASKKAEG
jgi:hypothetical protein